MARSLFVSLDQLSYQRRVSSIYRGLCLLTFYSSIPSDSRHIHGHSFSLPRKHIIFDVIGFMEAPSAAQHHPLDCFSKGRNVVLPRPFTTRMSCVCCGSNVFSVSWLLIRAVVILNKQILRQMLWYNAVSRWSRVVTLPARHVSYTRKRQQIPQPSTVGFLWSRY